MVVVRLISRNPKAALGRTLSFYTLFMMESASIFNVLFHGRLLYFDNHATCHTNTAIGPCKNIFYIHSPYSIHKRWLNVECLRFADIYDYVVACRHVFSSVIIRTAKCETNPNALIWLTPCEIQWCRCWWVVFDRESNWKYLRCKELFQLTSLIDIYGLVAHSD